MCRILSGFALMFFYEMKMVEKAFGLYVLNMNDEFCSNICAAECTVVSHDEKYGKGKAKFSKA